MSKSRAGAQDRISGLPDELLCKILCCLDTQCAVRTTVLSPRWNNLWTSLPDLWFCRSQFSGNDDDFMTFVDRVLFFRDSSDISKFYLKWPEVEKEENLSRIQSWICTAIRRNVVELDLNVRFFLDDDDETFELPRNLFTSKTLEVLCLSLEPEIIGNPPKSGCFPNLKVLTVTVHHPDDKNLLLGQILSYFPVLEDLSIYGDYWGNCALDFNISAPQLKRLTVDVDNIEDYAKYNFYVNAPRLEVFNHRDGDSSVFLFEIIAKSLLKANIDLSSCFLDIAGTNPLLDAISNVKQLSLSTLYLKGGVPAFDNLNHLKLFLCGFTCWRYLTEFLQRSRNLEYLVIINDFEGEHEDFSPPEVVPLCMLSHLKTITISSFKGRQDEMRVARYLLKYSEVLNRMTIFTSSAVRLRRKQALRDKFLMFERGSKTCQVKIKS